MKTLCIYHGGCTDGVASAWCVWKAIPECCFYPGVYQEEPPWALIKRNDRVLMVDFSYKHTMMEDVCECCSQVVVLDHHKTAKEELEPMLLAGVVSGVFDMDRCGSLIAWDYFHDQPCPNMLNEIDKQDRWLPDRNSKLIMALRSYPHAPENDSSNGFAELMDKWNWLMSAEGMSQLNLDGEAIYRYYQQRCKETEGNERLIHIDSLGIDLPVINAPFFMASDVAGRLAIEYESAGAAWWQNKDESVTFSLRSRPDFDVSEIAVFFGGGGHKNAAGFRMKPQDAAKLLFN